MFRGISMRVDTVRSGTVGLAGCAQLGFELDGSQLLANPFAMYALFSTTQLPIESPNVRGRLPPFVCCVCMHRQNIPAHAAKRVWTRANQNNWKPSMYCHHANWKGDDMLSEIETSLVVSPEFFSWRIIWRGRASVLTPTERFISLFSNL